eukprot:TRINITY_DN5228_c0_g1_i1.p3 TRINITY_DN5228_c0_g1~~TRINITY_DN5228_c0_g1_i1.p3  ORF type:complete len:122 (+),score=26.27 TRINITY_DN5228_c0_g1_i1:402-767(+)
MIQNSYLNFHYLEKVRYQILAVFFFSDKYLVGHSQENIKDSKNGTTRVTTAYTRSNQMGNLQSFETASNHTIYGCSTTKAMNSIIERPKTSDNVRDRNHSCLLYTSPSPRDLSTSRMPSSA